jgi:hypothetical protein
VAILSLSLAGLFLTHNIMTILFLPFYAGWLIYLLIQTKKIKLIPPFILSTLLGVGLASSFLLPAYFEKSFVQTSHLTAGYFDFRAHFIELQQFFKPFWGYGASVWGSEDGISFQVGLVHWFVLGLLVLLFMTNIRKKNTPKILIPTLLIAYLFSLFMQHNKSTFIWLSLPLLAFVQFPWRFLGISIFFVSLLGGAVALVWKRHLPFFAILVVLAVIVVNVRYFRPESYYDDSIDEHYIGSSVLHKDDKVPKDYLPIWVKRNADSNPFIPYSENGQANISNYNLRTSSASFNIEAEKPTTVQAPITFFPGWKVSLDNNRIALDDPSELGLIRFDVPEGKFEAKLEFSDTPVRRLGNYLSIASIIVVLYFLTKRKHGQE